MPGTATAGGFQLVIHLLSFGATFDAGSQCIALGPFSAIATNARKEALIIFRGNVHGSSVLRLRTGMRTLPLSNFGGAMPLVPEPL